MAPQTDVEIPVVASTTKITTAALRADCAIKLLAERTNAKKCAIQKVFFSTNAVFIRSKRHAHSGEPPKLSNNAGMRFWSHINFYGKCGHPGSNAVKHRL